MPLLRVTETAGGGGASDTIQGRENAASHFLRSLIQTVRHVHKKSFNQRNFSVNANRNRQLLSVPSEEGFLNTRAFPTNKRSFRARLLSTLLGGSLVPNSHRVLQRTRTTMDTTTASMTEATIARGNF